MQSDSFSLEAQQRQIKEQAERDGIVWMKPLPAIDLLFQLLNNLQVDDRRRFWILYPVADEDICDIGNELGQIATEVKIAFPMSHNDLRIGAARGRKTTPSNRAQPPHNPQLD